MRTLKAETTRRGWRGLPVAAAAALGVSLVAGCGLLGGHGSSQGEPSGPGPGSATQATRDADSQAVQYGGSPSASVQALDVWANDGCLEYLVLDSARDTVAVSATNLCRKPVSSFPGSAQAGPGTFYGYFARGGSLDNWQAVAGQGDDGDSYWEYSDAELYRQPADGEPAQLLVRYTDGAVDFEDESTYLQDNPGGLPFLRSVKEDLAAAAIAREEIGLPLQWNPRRPSASAKYTRAQDGISAADQQATEYGQAYQAATRSGGSSADQELVKVTQAQQSENRILFAKDCGDSDNVASGCGGASAFNDDGGVGEGGS